jgi:hypothetical protein
MARAILLGLILKVFFVGAQNTVSVCGSTTQIGNYDMFYPNTTSVYTGTAQQYFLCGPNTTLYDTISSPYLCSYGIIDSACTVIFKGQHICTADNKFLIKNYGTLIVKSSGAPVTIYKAPLANVVLQSSVTIFSYSCDTALVPSCAQVGLRENSLMSQQFSVFPNPSKELLNIQFTGNGSAEEFRKAEILNSLGQSVKLFDLNFANKIASVEINELPAGIYYLRLARSNGQTLCTKFDIMQ